MDSFFCSFSCQRPPHPLPATSAPSPAGCLSLSGAGVRLGLLNPTHCQFPPKKLHSLPQALAFLAELHRSSSKAPRLKSAVWSMVITSGVLNPSRGGVRWRELCDGWERESRAQADSKSLSCNGLISSSPVCLCVHCSQHAGSAPCPNACLENSCWSHLSPEESLISTHSTRSV